MISQKAVERPRRLYYGWVMVAVMSAISTLSMALATLNFGLFIKPMGDELGIGRAVFGWSQTARMGMGALTSPLVGRLIDKAGSRLLLPVAAFIAAGAMIAMASINTQWQMVALFAVMGLIALGGPNLATTVPIAKWFVRQRGRALAIVSAGAFAGGVIFVPVTEVFITELGWRQAWVALALIGGGLIIPLALIFVRRQPEDMGLAPDGASVQQGVAGEPSQTRAATPQFIEEASWTLAEARRSPIFWRVTIVFAIAMFATGTAGLHRIPDFVDRGLDPGLVALATSLDAAAGGVSTFTMGFVAERIPARVLAALTFGVLTIALALTIIADTPALLFLAMSSFGVGIGGMMLLQNYLWAEYFGRAHLGSIRGFVMPVLLLFSGVSAPLAGYVRDAFGSYNSIWWVSVALMALAAITILFTPKPGKPPVASTPS
ncbi:MAG: MFS transporter [Chloroflexi bacterium]|nr:MFS transporter [Chloroflexota bacterium]